MNIKIITIHAMHNPGSVFQAYALQEALSKKHDVQIIDYRPSYFYNEGSKIKLFLKKIIWRQAYKSRNLKFIGFVKKYLNLTCKYTSYEDLNSSDLKADVFMTGSDQLWNTDFPCGKDEAFYLAFVKTGKKVAYSTSVGKTVIDEFNMNFLKKRLQNFDLLSVREKINSEQLQKALCKKVQWVCDPVFLLPALDYKKFISEKNRINKPYAMVYLLKASDKLNQIVAYYRSKGLCIVLVGGFTKRCDCDLHVKDVGPEDFLTLIYYADVVISSSFHATSFCHIFHKDFVSLLPPKNGERISCLLKLSGLENRCVSVNDEVDMNKIGSSINWLAVDRSIEHYVEESFLFLEAL